DQRSEVAFSDYAPHSGATDLEGLRHFDTDDDLMLTADDAEFDKFAIWQDADGDGMVGEGELRSLNEAGIESIGLVSDGREYRTASGDVQVHGESEVRFSDGSTSAAADASFDYVERPAVDELLEPEDSDSPLQVVSANGETVDLDAPPETAPAAEATETPEATPEGPAPVSIADSSEAASVAAAM
ncbi:MAG: hypothetical protein AAF585_08285, partial [Verrucomicrobiota bacterium]